MCLAEYVSLDHSWSIHVIVNVLVRESVAVIGDQWWWPLRKENAFQEYNCSNINWKVANGTNEFFVVLTRSCSYGPKCLTIMCVFWCIPLSVRSFHHSPEHRDKARRPTIRSWLMRWNAVTQQRSAIIHMCKLKEIALIKSPHLLAWWRMDKVMVFYLEPFYEFLINPQSILMRW